MARHSELANVSRVPVRQVGAVSIAGRTRRGGLSDQGGLVAISGYVRIADAIRRDRGNRIMAMVVCSRHADELVHEDQPDTYREQDQQARPR